MFDSVMKEILKARNFTTPKKIILSTNNYNKLISEIKNSGGFHINSDNFSDLKVGGIEIQKSNLVQDNEMIKIKNEENLLDFSPVKIPVLPPFKFPKEEIDRISDLLVKAANQTAQSFRDLAKAMRSFAKAGKFYVARRENPRKRRANFKPHMRRRLKAINRRRKCK